MTVVVGVEETRRGGECLVGGMSVRDVSGPGGGGDSSEGG